MLGGSSGPTDRGLRARPRLASRRPARGCGSGRGRVDDQRRRPRSSPSASRSVALTERGVLARRGHARLGGAAGGTAIGLAIGWLVHAPHPPPDERGAGHRALRPHRVRGLHRGRGAARLRRPRRGLRRDLLRLVRAHRPGRRHPALRHRLLAGDGPRARGDAVHPPRPPGPAGRGRAGCRAARLAGRRRRPHGRRGADGLRDRPAGRLRRYVARAGRGRLGGHARGDLARRRALDPARRRGPPGDPAAHVRRDLRDPARPGAHARAAVAQARPAQRRALVARRGDRAAGDRPGGAGPARGARGGGRIGRAGAPPAGALPRPLRALRRGARGRRAARGRPQGAEAVRRDAARADPRRACRTDRPAQRPDDPRRPGAPRSSAISTSTRRGSVRSRLRRR